MSTLLVHRKTGDMSQSLGSALNVLQQAQDHANQSVDVLNSGIGSMVDADPGKVSARIRALQIQEQLAVQSLALGNQWPKLLLQLLE
jgi:flagellin